MLEELFSQIYRRTGKRISAERLELAEDLEEKLQQKEDYIASLRKGKRTKELSKSLERQVEIIEIIEASHENDFPLNYMELMGFLALQHGTKKDKLFPYAKAFSVMKQSSFLSSGGDAPYLRRALQQDLVSRIQRILQDTASPITSTDIAKKLGYKYVAYSDMISASLNLLEIINKAVRLPIDSRKHGKPYVWISSKYRHTSKTIPYWSIKYTILIALRDNRESTQNDLAKDKRIAKIVHVKRAFGRYKSMNVYSSLDDLIHSGLISYEVKAVKGRKGARKAIVYSITPTALELLRLTEQSGYLDEDLRRALIGEKYVGLKPSEEIALERIKRVATIYAKRRKDESVYGLARRIREDYGYVSSIFSGRNPLQFFKEETLREKYFPYLTYAERKGIGIYLKTKK